MSNRLFETQEPVACPGCKATSGHTQDRVGLWSCGNCGWRFRVAEDGAARSMLNLGSRRKRRSGER